MGDESNDFLTWSIAKLSGAIKSKHVSPTEVTSATLRAIAEKDATINAYITVMEEDALGEAKEAEREIVGGRHRGPLHGVPIGLKDLLFTEGVRTTSGSEIYKDFIPDHDAQVVKRLKDAGAVIVGKLNMHQFAYGTTGDRSYFGPVRNPHDSSKMAGGSSAGAGAAVAAFLCYGAIGSDTGGSIRIPASCCGIVGMKPTFGRVSKRGAVPLSWTLDHLGPMTRTAEDNAIMLNAISGYDAKDPYSIKQGEEDFAAEVGHSIEGITVGVPTSFYFDVIEPEVQRVFDDGVELLKRQGAEVVPVDLDHMDELLTAQQVILTAEAHAALEKELHESPDKIEEEVRGRIVSGILLQANEYLRALRVKHAAIESFQRAFESVDVIVTPTLCAVPPNIDQREMDLGGVKEHPRILARLTGPTNTVGFPSVSVPGGTSTDGLPVGLQLIGPAFAEKLLYRVAHQTER
jgi:aspartyl-tRNA(Asn)/glutamyl-tRNA(Gln) amidotransferase subunit A